MRHSRSNSRDIRATCQHEIMPAEKHDQRTPPRKTEKERERERERGRESRELTHSLFSSYSTANSASSLSRCLSVSLARRSTIRIDLRERANNRRKRHSEDRHRRSTVLVVLVTADSRWHVRTIAPPGLRVRSHMRARACARARPNRGSAVRMRLFEIEHTSEGSTFPRGNEHVASTRETDPYLLLPPLLFRDWFDPWCLSLTHSLSLSLYLSLSYSYVSLSLFLTLAGVRSRPSEIPRYTVSSSVSGHRVCWQPPSGPGHCARERGTAASTRARARQASNPRMKNQGLFEPEGHTTSQEKLGTACTSPGLFALTAHSTRIIRSTERPTVAEGSRPTSLHSASPRSSWRDETAPTRSVSRSFTLYALQTPVSLSLSPSQHGDMSIHRQRYTARSTLLPSIAIRESRESEKVVARDMQLSRRLIESPAAAIGRSSGRARSIESWLAYAPLPRGHFRITTEIQRALQDALKSRVALSPWQYIRR